MISIYALVDPRNCKVRYVGRSREPDRRFKAIMSSQARYNHRRHAWIARLAACGLTPRLEILERCKMLAAPAAEEKWIAAHRKTAYNGTARGLTKLARYNSPLHGASWYR